MIEYGLYCDRCGLLICVSRLSARAARADAQLSFGTNHGPDGDKCAACRKFELRQETERMFASGPTRPHSAGPGPPPITGNYPKRKEL